MRVAVRAAACAGLAFCIAATPGPARPQDTTVLAPEASAAKAREVIQRAIQAMGGAAYLGVKDITRMGRYTAFEHSGESRGTIKITDLVKLPDKERIEYDFKMYYGVDAPIPPFGIPYPLSKTRSSFEVRNGDEGWVLGSGGVIPMESDALARVRQARKKDIHLLFRTRLNDPSLVFRYTGQEVVDLKWVDGVEITDGERFTTRIAFDHSTRLPLRSIFLYRDPEYDNQPTEDRDSYSLYHLIQGVVTAFQISHEHNGYRTSQLFYEEVKYNTGLTDAMFTRESLEHPSKRGKWKRRDRQMANPQSTLEGTKRRTSTLRPAAFALPFLFAASLFAAQQKGQPAAVAPANDDPVMTLVGRGSQLYLAEDYKGAIGPYQKALDLEKQKSTLSSTMFRVLVDNLGMAYGMTGDLKHAEETFDYAISRDPTYPLFHYNQACTYAEMDDLDRALAQLGLAYKYKQNMTPGEEFPDPRTDDSFQRYMKNRRFLDFLKAEEQQPAPNSSVPPAIRGTLLRAGSVPIANAQVVLQVFNDEACAKLFDRRSDSPEGSGKLAKCSRDLFTVYSNEKGEFVFAGVQAGWYAVRFLWNIEPKPSTGPSADHIAGFLVLYAAQKDVSGRYDTLSQGPAFQFDAAQDYRIEFKY